MADKLLALSTFIVLTIPGLGLANRLPIWLTVVIITRDIVIVLTVAIVNLAIGPRTFRPSVFGKIATATYMMTAVVAMFFNFLGYHSVMVDLFVWASLAITLVSSLHYIWHAARIIDAPACSGRVGQVACTAACDAEDSESDDIGVSSPRACLVAVRVVRGDSASSVVAWPLRASLAHSRRPRRRNRRSSRPPRAPSSSIWRRMRRRTRSRTS